MAIDSSQNKVYVANFSSSTVTIIDAKSTSTVAVGEHPVAIAVNRNTHTAYTVNREANSVSVITSGIVTGTVATGSVPVRLAINDLTDQIYVVNISGGGVTVIDGKTNSTISVTAGAQPSSVAIDELRNKVYVQNGNGPSLTVIDGKTNTSTTLGNISSGADIVAVDVLTNHVYISTAYPTGSTVAVFSGANGTFPANLLDEMMGPVNGLN